MKSFMFFFSSRRRHTRLTCDWSSDVCSSDLDRVVVQQAGDATEADQAKRAVGYGTGRKQREVGPAAAVDGQLVDRSLVDVAGKVLLRRVDDRRFRADVNRSGHRSN